LIIIDISAKIDRYGKSSATKTRRPKKKYLGSASVNLLSKREEFIAEKIADAATIVI